jgi:hypothetical protein
MKRGRAIMSWTEPDTWRTAALSHAKQQGISTFPWFTWISVLGIVGGLIAWEWSNADPTKRASVPMLLCIITALFCFFVVLGWIHVRLNRTTKTTIYERGIFHESLTKKQWIPWCSIEYFYVEEESLGQQTFRFLTWLRLGANDEEFSVVPDDVDLEAAVAHIMDLGSGLAFQHQQDQSNSISIHPPPRPACWVQVPPLRPKT